RGHLERRVVAQGRPVDERLPGFVLAARQLRRMAGAVADEIGAGITRDLRHHFRAPHRHQVDGGAGEAGERQLVELHLGALGAPFLGDRLGERGAWHRERCLGRRAQLLAVEADAEGAAGGLDARLLVEALHRCGASSAKGLDSSLSSKPKNSQVAFMCGGSGAVTWSRPPRGCGSDSARAWRWSFRALGTPAGCAAPPPYLPSPRIGVSSATQCARSWCVRPVIGCSESQASWSPACETVR